MTEMVFGSAHQAQSEPVLPRWWRTVDRWTLLLVFLLFVIGMLLGQAASPPLAERNGLDPFHYVLRQGVFGLLALVTMVIISMMPPRIVRRLATLGFLGAFLALCLLPVFGTDYGKGAVRWFSLGFVSVQPAEFLKPGFVVVAAWLMSASFERSGPPGRILSFFLMALIVGILAAQPDFGQAGLIFAAWAGMIFVAGAPMPLLLALAGGAAGCGYLAYTLSEHAAGRIDRFLNATVEANSQLGYAITAIREGGLFGVGLGEGEVKWRLPDAHTDYIIAVAAEEYGLVMVLLLIALFLAITLRALFRLRREKDPFIRIAGAGLATLLAVQVFVNMGVSARLLPEKGMTLPFVSYGGSSVVAAGIMLGILLSLTRVRPQDDLEDALYAGEGRP